MCHRDHFDIRGVCHWLDYPVLFIIKLTTQYLVLLSAAADATVSCNKEPGKPFMSSWSVTKMENVLMASKTLLLQQKQQELHDSSFWIEVVFK